jgi:hypothetical protein
MAAAQHFNLIAYLFNASRIARHDSQRSVAPEPHRKERSNHRDGPLNAVMFGFDEATAIRLQGESDPRLRAALPFCSLTLRQVVEFDLEACTAGSEVNGWRRKDVH